MRFIRPRSIPGQATGTMAGHFPWTLMYHSVAIARDDPYMITVSPARFRRQLRWLSSWGLRGVAVETLLRCHREGTARGLVGLSFDDGYRDFTEEVMPALVEYGFTATVYVVAGRLGGYNDWDQLGPRKPLMTALQVREVVAAGLEIGSHGLTHQRLAGLGARDLAAQVAGSRRALEDLTGQEVAGFCYPYGSLDAAAVAAVAGAGYSYGCAVSPGAHGGRYAIPRAYIGDRDGPLRMIAKLARDRWQR
ncbi:polysaccharide deacetylase family protein [Kitasatospora sp. NPDC001309]|uniref:polysaccharide deacetylase family protein n=1 Tax=Kitasatospora sp. NPDC001309 TaxID=3364013 RepID=UPI003692CA46